MVNGMMDPPQEVRQSEVDAVVADLDALESLVGDVSSASPSGMSVAEKLESTWIYATGVGARYVELSAAFFGAWDANGDGARTNGAGLVGGNVAIASVGNAFCVVDDGGVFSLLSSGVTGRVQWKLWPDTPANNDAFYVGAVHRFCEIAVDLSATVATYTGNAIAAEYWNGSAWTAISGLIYDNSQPTLANRDGQRPFGRDGALAFQPPTAWAQTTINGQVGFWIRFRVNNAANLGTVPITNNVNIDTVSVHADNAWKSRYNGTIRSMRLSSRATTLGSTQDTKFLLVNWTKVNEDAAAAQCFSNLLTWARGNKNFNITSGIDFAIADGDNISVLVLQEDGTNEPLDVHIQMWADAA